MVLFYVRKTCMLTIDYRYYAKRDFFYILFMYIQKYRSEISKVRKKKCFQVEMYDR